MATGSNLGGGGAGTPSGLGGSNPLFMQPNGKPTLLGLMMPGLQRIPLAPLTRLPILGPVFSKLSGTNNVTVS